jgi:hypothetical protein
MRSLRTQRKWPSIPGASGQFTKFCRDRSPWNYVTVRGIHAFDKPLGKKNIPVTRQHHVAAGWKNIPFVTSLALLGPMRAVSEHQRENTNRNTVHEKDLRFLD